MTATVAHSTSESYLPAGMPLPAPSIDGLDQEFWNATRRHELLVQQCNQCKGFQWGPEWLCYHCHSFDMGWAQVSGRGRIYSWERCWHPVHPALRQSGPYIVVIVELPDADNVRMLGNLLGDPLQEVIIGSEVQVVFEDHDDEQVTLVQWRSVES